MVGFSLGQSAKHSWLSVFLCLLYFLFGNIQASLGSDTEAPNCLEVLQAAAKEEVKQHPWRRRLYFALRRTTKRAIASFMERNPNPDILEVENFRAQLQKQLQMEWENFKSLPKKAAVVTTYFSLIGGVPTLVSYVTSSMPDYISSSATVVSGLLAAYVFNPLAKPFLVPIANAIERLSVGLWTNPNETDPWIRTYGKYTGLNRDIAKMLGDAILTLEINFDKARQAIKKKDNRAAVKWLGDAAMRFWENFSGLSPDNITLMRFTETILADGIEVPKELGQWVSQYIKAYYRDNSDKLPSFLSKCDTNERKQFIENVVSIWLRPVDLDKYLPRETG